MQQSVVNGVDREQKWLYRLGGISAILISLGYVIITALYILVGARPSGGESWLKYLANHTTVWWVIVALSVITDLLFVPVLISLYHALKEGNRYIMLLGTGLVGLFIILDLAITWPNYSTLLAISGNYTAATSEAQRAAFIAAANYASAVVTSPVLSIYIILFPALGTLIISVVMLKGIFSKATAYAGIATGVFGIVTVVGPIFISVLGLIGAILTSILTLIWFLFVGCRLYRLSQVQNPAALAIKMPEICG